MSSYYAVYVLLLLFYLTNPISAQIRQQQQPIQANNAYEIAKQIPQISKFVSMLDSPFQQYLIANVKNNITVLAPNNDALSELNKLDSNSTWYHLIPRFCPLTECEMVETKLDGAFVKIINQTIESGLMHHARVIKSIQLQTVIVHILDKILTVPVDAQTTLFKLGYAKAGDMVAQAHEIHSNNQVTLFMPNNKAFGTVDPLDLGDDVNKLLFDAHVTKGVSNSQTWKNDTKLATLLPNNSLTLTRNDSNWYGALDAENHVSARILVQDILLENGVMHIIDQVLWANNWARITKPATSNAGESQYKLNRSINILTVVLFVTFNMCVTRSL